MTTLPSAKFISGPPPSASRRRRRWILAIPIACILVGAGIVLYPFFPKVGYALHKPDQVLPYESNLLNKTAKVTTLPGTNAVNGSAAITPRVKGINAKATKPKPKTNRLVIPSIGVDMPILEGPTEKTLDRGGAWHIPNTSDPVKGGNFVISGHRWKYLPPSSMTLYLLDKVQDGDPIIVYWQGVEYDYIVTGHKIVNPNQTDILNDTAQPRLTVFTCTPLFSTARRLVLFADLIS